MKKELEFPIHFKGSLEELEQLARELAYNLEGGEVLGLVGDLGAGKTTFSQMLGRELGVLGRMASPTFLIHKSYEGVLPESHKKITLNHLDIYRLGGEIGLEELGINEMMKDESAVSVIEWADKIAKQLPKSVKYIYFEKRNETQN